VPPVPCGVNLTISCVTEKNNVTSDVAELSEKQSQAGTDCDFLGAFKFETDECIENYQVKVTYKAASTSGETEEIIEFFRSITSIKTGNDTYSEEMSKFVGVENIYVEVLSLEICPNEMVEYEIKSNVEAEPRGEGEVCIAMDDYSFSTVGKLTGNDPPDAEDDSKTTTPKESVSDNVIEPNDSDPEGDDLTVSKVNGQPIDDNDGVSTITLPSGAAVTINTDGGYTYDPRFAGK